MVNSVVVTAGEPSSIGPDLVLELAQQSWPVQLVICSDINLLKDRAKLLNKEIKFLSYNKEAAVTASKKGTLTVAHIPLIEDVELGVLNKNNAQF